MLVDNKGMKLDGSSEIIRPAGYSHNPREGDMSHVALLLAGFNPILSQNIGDARSLTLCSVNLYNSVQ
jgi:hypothetical protein